MDESRYNAYIKESKKADELHATIMEIGKEEWFKGTLWNMIRVMGIIKGIQTWLWWNKPLTKFKKISILKE